MNFQTVTRAPGGFSFRPIILFFFLAAVLLTSASGQSPRDFTIDDLQGRWERWPEKRGEKGVWLYTYITKGEGNSVSVDLKLSDFEQNEFGPLTPGRTPAFTGEFDPDGFNVTVECSTKALCLQGKYIFTSSEKPTPDVVPRQLRTAPDINVPYRYHIKPIRKDLLLVTAYTPTYTVGDKVFTNAKPEAVVRSFYLTRNDTCEKSKDAVKKELINGEFGDRLLLALGPPKPLVVGTRVIERAAREEEIFKLAKQQCFFFIDLVPTARFSHPVLYVLADETKGEIVSVKPANSPPLILEPDAGQMVELDPYGTIEDRIESPDLLFPQEPGDLDRPVVIDQVVAGGTTTLDLDRRRATNPFVNIVFSNVDEASVRKVEGQNCTESRKVALLVNGGREKSFANDVREMVAFFTSLKFDRIEVADWDSSSLQSIRDKAKEVGQDLGACDVFVLFYTGHVFNRPPFVAFDYNAPFPGTTFKNHPWSITNLASNPLPKVFSSATPETGPGVLYAIQTIKAGHISLIIDMCHSEALIYEARNPSVGEPIAKSLKGDQKLKIFGASSIRQLSFSLAGKKLFRFDLGGQVELAEGGLFTQQFSQIAQRYISDVAPDRNGDGKIVRSEYEIAEDEVFKRTSRAVALISREVREFKDQDPVSATFTAEPPGNK